jgi:hypothetical protein
VINVKHAVCVVCMLSVVRGRRACRLVISELCEFCSDHDVMICLQSVSKSIKLNFLL